MSFVLFLVGVDASEKCATFVDLKDDRSWIDQIIRRAAMMQVREVQSLLPVVSSRYTLNRA
jgi:hypothetical protein